jgi:hypothetical protein
MSGSKKGRLGSMTLTLYPPDVFAWCSTPVSWVFMQAGVVHAHPKGFASDLMGPLAMNPGPEKRY